MEVKIVKGGVVGSSLTPEERRAWVEEHSDYVEIDLEKSINHETFHLNLNILSDRTISRLPKTEWEDLS